MTVQEYKQEQERGRIGGSKKSSKTTNKADHYYIELGKTYSELVEFLAT